MLYFIFGIILGFVIAILIVATLTFFRRTIEHRVNIIEKQIESVGPKPKGFIIDPPDEIDDMRNEIIEKNKQEGRDTPISDLQ